MSSCLSSTRQSRQLAVTDLAAAHLHSATERAQLTNVRREATSGGKKHCRDIHPLGKLVRLDPGEVLLGDRARDVVAREAAHFECRDV